MGELVNKENYFKKFMEELVNKECLIYLAHLLPVLNAKGIQLTAERRIDYGIQLTFSDGKHQILLNLYYSEKRGISAVIGGKKENPLREILSECLDSSLPKKEIPPLHDWDAWIGSDESGKGNLFGPLVVCAFYCRTEDRDKLVKLGNRDSKDLRDSKLMEIAKNIYRAFPSNSECLIIRPRKYNELYDGFFRQKKNLNDILAWAHAKNIENLQKRFPEAQGVLIDRFSVGMKPTALLKKNLPDLSVVERHGAEIDLAVATASVLARFQLLQAFQIMEKSYRLKFPLGASDVVKQTRDEFIAKYGKERLGEVAKLHFKTSRPE